jgi:hypothetical protein
MVGDLHAPGYAWLAVRVAEAAAGSEPADEVVAMLSVAGADTWIGLDRAFRTSAVMYVVHTAVADGPMDERLVSLVAACSPDGHARESAVAASPIDGFLLPVLVLRTADWVPQVREQARRSLAVALQAADGPALLTAASISAAMGSWERGGHALDAVAAALRSASEETLASARTHQDRRLRRLAYRLWLERAQHGDVLHAALHEPDVVCRVLCAERIVAEAVRDERVDLLGRLLEEGSAKVRIEALTALVKLGRPEAGEAHLADRSAMMRATAQWAVRREGRAPATLYRRALATDSAAGRTRALVAGLGECGTHRDVDVLLPFLEHASPRVRAEAVRAVRRLGGSPTQVARMLADPAPVVVRAAHAALRTQPDVVPVAQLWELLAADSPAHVRAGAYELLRAGDTWTRVHLDLHLLAGRDAELGRRAHADLTVWLRSEAATAYRKPSQGLLQRISTLLVQAEPLLEADHTRRLRWLLGIG